LGFENSNSSESSGQALRRKSGYATQIRLDGLDLSKVRMKEWRVACTLSRDVCRKVTVALLKFGDVLKFLAKIIPDKGSVSIYPALRVTNDVFNARSVCYHMS
jgi:hypothetical protein